MSIYSNLFQFKNFRIVPNFLCAIEHYIWICQQTKMSYFYGHRYVSILQSTFSLMTSDEHDEAYCSTHGTHIV